MGSDWTKCTLSKIADIQTGPFGSQLHASDYVTDGIPSIMPQNIGDNRINEDGIARITRDDAQRLEKYRVKTGDIVYSRRGDVELRALIRERENGWLCGTGCLRVRISTPEVDSEFASFYLSTSWSRAWIVQHAHGATMPNLNTSILGEVPFAYPDIKTQHSIAATLSCLDDKIELNNRIIANLEAQAQAIFKSWFVDFEPFQDGEFEDSELGLIPKGWRVGTLEDACVKITDGSHFSPAESIDGEFPMLSVKDMESYGFSYNSCKWINKDDFNAMVANDCVPQLDDILVAKDGSYLKHVFIINDEYKQGILSSIAIFRPNVEVLLPELLLYLLKNPDVQQTIKDNFVSGSALPRIVLKDFKKLKIILPPQIIQNKVHSYFSGIRLTIENFRKEIETLSEIRDTLLPKLMSGGIEI